MSGDLVPKFEHFVVCLVEIQLMICPTGLRHQLLNHDQHLFSSTGLFLLMRLSQLILTAFSNITKYKCFLSNDGERQQMNLYNSQHLSKFLTIQGTGTNTSLQMYLLLYFGSCVNGSALFLSRSFPLPSSEMYLSPPEAGTVSHGSSSMV